MKEAISSDESATPRRPLARSSDAYVWYVVFLLTLTNVFNYMDRFALAILVPAIKVDLSLSDGQLGLLVGFAFSLFYAICGIPIARWSDRGIRRNIIAAALATWSIMTAISGAAHSFWQLFAARVGVGVGEAGCIPPGQSMLCDYVPLTRRPAVFAIHNFGAIAGMMVGMALAGSLVGSIGWRWTFVTLGVPGIVLALIVRLTLREPTREFSSASHALPRSSIGATLKILWRGRTFRLLTLALIMSSFVQLGMHQWWPSIYTRLFGLSTSEVGLYLGVAIGVGAGTGTLGGGFLANKLARHDVRWPLLIGAISTSLAAAVAVASLFVASAYVSIVLVGVTGVLVSMPNGAIIAGVYSATPTRVRAMAGAVSIFFTAVLGAGLGPLCVGVLSDLLAPSYGAQSLRFALLLPIALFPVVVAALYAAAKVLPQDLRAVGHRIVVDESRPRVRIRMAAAE